MNGSFDTGEGVQALIARLRAEGVDAGREQAEQLLAQAHADAARVRAEAEGEVLALRERVHAELRQEREAALGALRLAWRDALLTLHEEVERRLGERLASRLAAAAPPAWPALLAPLAQPEGGVPPERELQALLAELLAHCLEQGFEPLPGSGMRLRHRDGAPELELGAEAVAGWLMQHAAPHLRRLLEGSA